MDRRALLTTAGTSAALVGLGGCLERLARESDTTTETPSESNRANESGAGSEWQHDVGGFVSTVADGLVIGRRGPALEVRDQLFALDAATGDHQWEYQGPDGYNVQTDLTVDDAIYFGRGDDAIGSGRGTTYALTFDGEERWTRSTGSIYSPPRVDDGVVYVVGDDAVVRAFATADGTPLWDTEFDEQRAIGNTVAGIGESVYVCVGTIAALDPDDGTIQWTSGALDETIRTATAVDDVVYLTDRHGVAAVADGETRWRVPFESHARIEGITPTRVIVAQGDGIYAFDTTTGDERWRLEDSNPATVTVHGDRVYVGGGEIRALETTDGHELWTETVEAGVPVGTPTVVDEGDEGSDHAAYVQTDETRLHRLDADGEVTWTKSFESEIRNLVVDGRVFVGTASAIHALAPQR